MHEYCFCPIKNASESTLQEKRTSSHTLTVSSHSENGQELMPLHCISLQQTAKAEHVSDTVSVDEGLGMDRRTGQGCRIYWLNVSASLFFFFLTITGSEKCHIYSFMTPLYSLKNFDHLKDATAT